MHLSGVGGGIAVMTKEKESSSQPGKGCGRSIDLSALPSRNGQGREMESFLLLCWKATLTLLCLLPLLAAHSHSATDGLSIGSPSVYAWNQQLAKRTTGRIWTPYTGKTDPTFSHLRTCQLEQLGKEWWCCWEWLGMTKSDCRSELDLTAGVAQEEETDGKESAWERSGGGRVGGRKCASINS